MIATKPYVSSGSYINKMSNYCKSCHYNVKSKIDQDSCPFNSLYWNFLDDKKEILKTNQRMRMMYSVLDKIDKDTLVKMKLKADDIIKNPNKY
jgi:deoxyribodipyrimidine photolyase-related protein